MNVNLRLWLHVNIKIENTTTKIKTHIFLILNIFSSWFVIHGMKIDKIKSYCNVKNLQNKFMLV